MSWNRDLKGGAATAASHGSEDFSVEKYRGPSPIHSRAYSSAWLEHLPLKQGVLGPNPSGPTKHWPLSSVGRAFGLHPTGHRFESYSGHTWDRKQAEIAKVVTAGAWRASYAGSSPALATLLRVWCSGSTRDFQSLCRGSIPLTRSILIYCDIIRKLIFTERVSYA